MKTLLLINDCKFESIIIKDLLEKMGCKVYICNEFRFMEAVEKFTPDILIANLIMKRTTGDSIIKQVKAKHNNIVCVLSSCNDIKIENYKNCGVDYVLNTPVSQEKIDNIFKFK